MQLDQTHVTIRARTLTEISDLSMVIIRSYPIAAIVGFGLGAAPWAVANAFLIGSIPISEFEIGAFDDDMSWRLISYQVLMALLVFLQTPIAGVFTTLYIGQAVFETRPTWRSVLTEAKELFARWFWVLGVLRGPLPVMLYVLFLWGREESYEIDYVMPISIAIAVIIIRAFRPYVPEILLLERCPIRATSKANTITASKRSGALHRPIGSELFGRFFALSMLYVAMAFLGFYSLLWTRGVLFGLWEWDSFVYLVLYPIALWAAGGLSVLIRFLSYLDTRIRLEGWEVQLAVLAEAIRQFGDRDKPLASEDGRGAATIIGGRQ